MKGWKINLASYEIEVIKIGPDNRPVMKNNEMETMKKEFNVKVNMASVIMSRKPKDGREFIKMGKLAERIEECKEDHIILGLTDLALVKKSFEDVSGIQPHKNHLEMFQRVLETSDEGGPEEVELEEK